MLATTDIRAMFVGPTRFAAIENLKARWLRRLITGKRHDEAAELALAGALAWPRMPSDFGFWIFDLRLGEGRAGSRRRAVRDYGAQTPRRGGRIGAGGGPRLAAKAARFWIFRS